MNLSSFLQMPPAPLVSSNTANAMPQGTRVGAVPSAGNNLGFDFADVMARQLERLVPPQRQTIAADTSEQAQPVSDPQDSRPVEERRSADRPAQETQPVRADHNTPETGTSEDASSGQRHPRSKNTTQTTKHTDVDVLLAGLMQGAPITPTPVAPTETIHTTDVIQVASNAAAPTLPQVLTPTLVSTAAAISTSPLAAQTTPTLVPALVPANANAPWLQTVELSPQMRIITDPKKAPSPESLAAFAKSMGLDESAIQNLLAQQPATPATALVSSTEANLTGLPQTQPNGLQAVMGSVLNGAAPQTATNTTQSAVATQLAAMAASAEQPVSVSGAASGKDFAAATTTLTAPTVSGLTPTDMAAIQQLQITVLPAAVLPINTNPSNAPVLSTIDMLSRFGTGVDEKDVSALLSHFSQETDSDNNPDQAPSQDGGNNSSNFSQALSSNKNAANVTSANAAQVSATHMSEVYDQLSDKMATEMAARIHKQLSDGEWKMKFALRPSNLGGVEIQLEMKDGKLDAVFRADNPLTRDLLQNSSQRLKEALANFGINAGQVNVGQGGGNAQQNNSGNASKHSQVRDNSSSQVSGAGNAASVTSTRNKANASLLDLYA